LLASGFLLVAAVACADGAGLPSLMSGDADDGVYRDSFAPGQTGRWLLEQDDLGSSAVLNEQLVITVNAPNTIQYAQLEEPAFGDFVMEVDARLRTGPPESTYGILFRLADPGQFYRFALTGTGSYMVERHNADGTWTRFVPEWRASPAINQGLNVANRIKVIATGSDMAFYVNDILLEQISDDAYTAGAVALEAGTFTGDNLQVSFDDVVITGAPPAE
jgi:hypothetical protein